MSRISTHILDLTLGRPAAAVTVRLEREEGGAWQEIFRGVTDADGRIGSLNPVGAVLQVGRYRLGFETGPYFRAQGLDSFYPYIEVVVDIDDPEQRYHIPLLLTPYSYSTYRGS